MTTEELSELTRGWQGLPWETRDLFARWLAGVLKSQGLDLAGGKGTVRS